MIAQILLAITVFLIIPLSISLYVSSEKIADYFKEEIAKPAEINLKSIENMNLMLAESIFRNTADLSMKPEIDQLESVRSFKDILNNPENIAKANAILTYLQNAFYKNSMLHSINLYQDDTDYCINTYDGIVSLNKCFEQEWLDIYTRNKDNSTGHFWISREIPYYKNISDKQPTYTHVLSYFYVLTPITTNLKGVIVVNIFENELYKFINNSSLYSSSYIFIIDNEGNVISHADKSLVGQNKSKESHIRKILESDDNAGYFIDTSGGIKKMYVYNKSGFNNWIYITVNPMDELLMKVNKIRMQSLTFNLFIIFIGTAIIILVTIKLYDPINKVVKSIKSSEDINISINRNRNEAEIIYNVFEQMNKRQYYMKKVIEDSRRMVKDLYVTDLLKGNTEKYEEREEDVVKFPFSAFVIAVFSIDDVDAVSNDNISGYKELIDYIITDFCSIHEYEHYLTVGTVLERNLFSIIFNIQQDYYTEIRDIHDLIQERFGLLRDKSCSILCTTISVGVGDCHENISGINRSYIEALRSHQRRIIAGKNSTIFWSKNFMEKGNYFYPYNIEKHILNYMQTNNFEELKNALKKLTDEIKGQNSISIDNINQIFNQLIGATIKQMIDMNINISDIIDYNIYNKLSTRDTLDEIYELLCDFYMKIVEYINAEKNDKSYADRIFAYLKQNFRKEINFDRMSEEIGISYSYIRKIIKEKTGQSFQDYVNSLRLDEAKRLLKETSWSTNKIAESVGFSNIQSFNRTFKKAEGITPGEFRKISE